jgi:hypothetical protein
MIARTPKRSTLPATADVADILLVGGDGRVVAIIGVDGAGGVGAGVGGAKA